MPINEWTEALAADELPDNDIVGIKLGATKVCLARVGGDIYAINDICSHFYTRLSSGELYEDELAVQCPLHDSKFSLLDGKPHSEPAEKPVETYAVKVEEGTIYVGPRV
ncbi:Ferredoxin, 2Fe-2S [Rhodococcus wratislaviensis]|uniref:Ferredoxin, 2Fe-2S n=1 Tax=Rhodococcus wratislaviensis TaxID=44752 RepID=A0A402CKV4_RHOWR|nr:non-heme iron oxygenase ferredoxin subunit [Rhodococcus wratislaviensis]GCE44251.1 Ferredoxin, 2Fe-2S [Rhodococcus wratislaviensis]